MAKVIAIINHKGGVGKTATATSLGGALHKKGYKTLLIDTDGQANLTKSLGFSLTEEKTLLGAMSGEYDLPILTNNDGLQVVPACLDLAIIEAVLAQEPGKELILSSLIKPLKDQYDFILIDCPPSLALLTVGAMTAADSILIPVQSEYLAACGIGSITNVLHKVQKHLNPDLKIEGIVMTMFDKRTTLNNIVSDIVKEGFEEYLYKTMIRRNISIGEATAAGQDIINYSPRSIGAKDYIELCNEFLERQKNTL